jgi:hypothetical protein
MTRPTRRRLSPGVERVPCAVEVDLEPGGEVNRLAAADVDVRYVAAHIARGDVQRAAEPDRQVREVAADAPTGAVGNDRRGPRVRRAGHPLEVIVYEVDDRLRSQPGVTSPKRCYDSCPSSSEAEAARRDEGDVLVG